MDGMTISHTWPFLFLKFFGFRNFLGAKVDVGIGKYGGLSKGCELFEGFGGWGCLRPFMVWRYLRDLLRKKLVSTNPEGMTKAGRGMQSCNTWYI